MRNHGDSKAHVRSKALAIAKVASFPVYLAEYLVDYIPKLDLRPFLKVVRTKPTSAPNSVILAGRHGDRG